MQPGAFLLESAKKWLLLPVGIVQIRKLVGIVHLELNRVRCVFQLDDFFHF